MYANNQYGDYERFVLVVDDEPLVRTMASRMIRHLGYGVLTADSGAAAISIYEQISRQEHPQASALSMAILDMTMPEMNGLETGQRIKSILPDVPIVLSTGHRVENVMNNFSVDEIDAFLQKPFSLADVEQVLQQVMKPAVQPEL